MPGDSNMHVCALLGQPAPEPAAMTIGGPAGQSSLVLATVMLGRLVTMNGMQHSSVRVSWPKPV